MSASTLFATTPKPRRAASAQSKEVRDAANKKMSEDPRMIEWGEAMKFVDGKRMVFGGFVPIMAKQV